MADATRAETIFHDARELSGPARSEFLDRAGKYAYRDRRAKKRDFRGLWISRLSAATNGNNISYSRFINALTKAKIALNRKMLSEIAIHDPKAFEAIVSKVRSLAPTN